MGVCRAIQQMTNYKPEDSAEGTSNPPLLQYLELVNVVDTVTSILQVYFDKDLVSSPGRIRTGI